MAYRQNGLRMADLHSVKVDGIDDRTSSQELEEAFGKFGTVQDIYIPRDYHSQKSRGFAFVRFEHKDEATDAADATVNVAGLEVRCALAHRGKKPLPPRGRGDSRGRRGGGRDRRDSRRPQRRSPARKPDSRSRSRGRGGRR